MRICGHISSTGPGPGLDLHISGGGLTYSGSEGPPRAPTTLVVATPPAPAEWCAQRQGRKGAGDAQAVPTYYPAYFTLVEVQLGSWTQ